MSPSIWRKLARTPASRKSKHLTKEKAETKSKRTAKPTHFSKTKCMDLSGLPLELTFMVIKRIVTRDTPRKLRTYSRFLSKEWRSILLLVYTHSHNQAVLEETSRAYLALNTFHVECGRIEYHFGNLTLDDISHRVALLKQSGHQTSRSSEPSTASKMIAKHASAFKPSQFVQNLIVDVPIDTRSSWIYGSLGIRDLETLTGWPRLKKLEINIYRMLWLNGICPELDHVLVLLKQKLGDGMRVYVADSLDMGSVVACRYAPRRNIDPQTGKRSLDEDWSFLWTRTLQERELWKGHLPMDAGAWFQHCGFIPYTEEADLAELRSDHSIV